MDGFQVRPELSARSEYCGWWTYLASEGVFAMLCDLGYVRLK